MLKDSETSRYSTRRTHRTYTPQFKAELVAICQEPGVSIAAVATQHGMNANVLHRWLKEYQRGGGHAWAVQAMPAASPAPDIPAFVPVALPRSVPEPKASEIKIELRKGALAMVFTWPATATTELADWTAALLK